jgi:hypothetical protein
MLPNVLWLLAFWCLLLLPLPGTSFLAYFFLPLLFRLTFIIQKPMGS